MREFKYPRFELGEKLTDEQLSFFDKHGVIHFKKFLKKETVDFFIKEIQQVEQELLANGTDKVNGIPVKFGVDENGNKMIQRLAFTSQFSEPLHEFLKDPRLQLLIELLQPYDGRVGEDEKDGLVLNHYVNTPNSEHKQMGWHTDSPRDLFLGSKILPMLNVGIHLDDCPMTNGGLRVLPGTHKQNVMQILFKKKQFIDNNPDKNEIGIDIEAGDLTVHDGRAWHRVERSPNLGAASRRRVMYIPIITGEYKPKTASSKTPFYHKLGKLKKIKSMINESEK
jgi:phytanoyl-CoA hydroxylase